MRDNAVLAGGCFWGMESVFEHVKGVTGSSRVTLAAMRGTPATTQVSSEGTGDAEAVKITYDPKQISYAQLLQIYFTVAHDPTEADRQGPDVGHSYRSAIFPQPPEQARFAKAFIARLGGSPHLQGNDRDQDRERRLLPGRGRSPGFCAKSTHVPVHRRQRPTESRRAAEKIPRSLQSLMRLSG